MARCRTASSGEFRETLLPDNDPWIRARVRRDASDRKPGLVRDGEGLPARGTWLVEVRGRLEATKISEVSQALGIPRSVMYHFISLLSGLASLLALLAVRPRHTLSGT